MAIIRMTKTVTIPPMMAPGLTVLPVESVVESVGPSFGLGVESTVNFCDGVASGVETTLNFRDVVSTGVRSTLIFRDGVGSGVEAGIISSRHSSSLNDEISTEHFESTLIRSPPRCWVTGRGDQENVTSLSPTTLWNIFGAPDGSVHTQ